MDIFNKKKLAATQKTLKESLDKERKASRILKLLIEEPDSKLSILISKMLHNKYMENKWSGLTRDCHLGSLYTSDKDIQNKADYLIKGL